MYIPKRYLVLLIILALVLPAFAATYFIPRSDNLENLGTSRHRFKEAHIVKLSVDKIVAGRDGDIEIDPGGFTGNFIVEGIEWPAVDGSAYDMLETDGAGTITWDKIDSTNVEAVGIASSDIRSLVASKVTAIGDSAEHGARRVANDSLWYHRTEFVADVGDSAEAGARRVLIDSAFVQDTQLAAWAGSANITTLGTIGTGTWNADIIAVAKGGTGAGTYTAGQLLIGNTLTDGLDVATLTEGTGMTIANGNGSISISTNDGEINHDALNNYVANKHLDWTQDLGATNIHANNYTNSWRGIDDTPVDGQTAESITSNWAFDHAAAVNPHANITTLGTIGTGTWAATIVNEAYGGTGESTYTDGQLLIGNSLGSDFSKATITSGTGVTVVNGNGSITLNSEDGEIDHNSLNNYAANEHYTKASINLNDLGDVAAPAPNQGDVLTWDAILGWIALAP